MPRATAEREDGGGRERVLPREAKSGEAKVLDKWIHISRT
jgi:hypothetical protein